MTWPTTVNKWLQIQYTGSWTSPSSLMWPLPEIPAEGRVKSSYRNMHCDGIDSRKTWQTISEPTSRKSGKTAVTSLKVNGVSITNPNELSNEFNNHFATIGPELSCNIDSPGGYVYQRYITSKYQCFQLRPTSVNKVFSPLNNDIICKYQSGFRAIHSSVTALLEVTGT